LARRHALTVCLAAALVAGCGGGGDGLNVPHAASAEAQGPAARYAALQALDARVATVFHRLVTANVDLCGAPGRSSGWSLHAANQYGAEMRPVVAATGDLKGDLPAVLAVVPGGPAARAGLEVGDVILSVDGTALSIGAIDAAESWDGVARNLAAMDAALADDGPAMLEISRGGAVRTVRLTADPACPHSVQLDVSDELNARANGTGVFISTALAGFAANDDELALILAHELAHNILKHRERFDREAPARRVFGNLAVAPSSLAAAERDADRWGLYLMARAGFDVDVAAPFWRRFGAANWRVRWAQWGHPSAEVRARQLEAVSAEIADARARTGRIDPR
jgi:hypothetical protein